VTIGGINGVYAAISDIELKKAALCRQKTASNIFSVAQVTNVGLKFKN